MKMKRTVVNEVEFFTQNDLTGTVIIQLDEGKIENGLPGRKFVEFDLDTILEFALEVFRAKSMNKLRDASLEDLKQIITSELWT